MKLLGRSHQCIQISEQRVEEARRVSVEIIDQPHWAQKSHGHQVVESTEHLAVVH